MAKAKPSPANHSGKDTAFDAELVRRRLAELRPVLASAVVGDFSKDLKIPAKEDEFTELFVGVQMMTEVIREQLHELRELNQKLEAKAAERSRALEAAQALTHLGSWEWDITSGRISWSDELYRIYGLKPQERQVGFEEFMAMIHPDDRQRASNIIGQSFQSGQPFAFEHRIILPGGRHRVLYGMGKVVKDAAGKPLRMVGTSQDITERKLSQQALEQGDERFRAVSKATHDLVYDLDMLEGTIWFNEVLESDYGYRQPQVENSLEWWARRIHPDDALRVEDQLSRLLRGKAQTWHDEYRFQKADGNYALVRNRAFILRDSDGLARRIIGSCLDITESKRLERAKDEFISLVSHQLRTPLTVIRLYGNMLTDGMAGPLDPLQQDYVAKISGASIRLIKLVGDILNISRLELNRIRVETTPTDAGRLIQARLDELAPLAEANGVTVRFTAAAAMGRVPIDATVFGEIVHNLASNAIRYARRQDGVVTVKFQQQARGYLLTVADNGIGIPAAAQPHIFERFYRAGNAAHIDGEGTGLGLYLVKQFVETAGGQIWFKSTLHKGTTFSVLFPPQGMRANRT